MRRFNKSSAMILGAAFLLLGISSGWAQYTIPADAYPAIGTVSIYTADTTGAIAVAVGPAGENQTWTFTNLLNGRRFQTWYTETLGIAYADSFPEAQWVQMSQQWISMDPIPPILNDPIHDLFALNTFERMENSTVYGIGVGTVTPFYSGGFRFVDESIQYPLPLEYGKTWNRNSTFDEIVTMYISGIPIYPEVVMADSVTCLVDGWGKLALPMGTFDCVRLKLIRHLVVKAKILGTWIPISEGTYLMYEWHTRKAGMILQISSHNGETNPDFAEAGQVVRMEETNAATAVECDPDCEGSGNGPSSYVLGQNYPNPFNPSTGIRYSVPTASRVELTVYTMLGQPVVLLDAGTRSRGEYRITWDGNDSQGRPVSAGVYFYRLKASPLDGSDSSVQTRKMILAR